MFTRSRRLIVSFVLVLASLVLGAHVALASDVDPTSDGFGYVVVTDDGEAVALRSEQDLATGPDQDVTDVLGNSYHGYVFAGVEGDASSAGGSLRAAGLADFTSFRVATGQVVAPRGKLGWFSGNPALVWADLGGLDTSAVTDMSQLFVGCRSLRSIDLSCLDTSNVTSLHGLALGCVSLESANLVGCDTHSVTDMGQMFMNCVKLRSVYAWGLDTSHVTTAAEAFISCEALEEVSGMEAWDMSRLEDGTRMFLQCKSMSRFDLSRWGVRSLREANLMLYLVGINVRGAGATVRNRYKTGCSVDISGWDISNVPSYYNSDGKLRSFLTGLGLGAGEGNVVELSMRDVTLPSFAGNWDEGFVDVINKNPLRHLDVAGLRVSGTRPSSAFRTFAGVTSPVLDWLDVTDIEMRGVWNAGMMFAGERRLTCIVGLDTLRFSQAGDMRSMFLGDASLVSCDLSKAEAGGAYHPVVASMFGGCSALSSVDVSGVRNVSDATEAFSGCSALATLDVSSWEMSGIASRMCVGCDSLGAVTLGPGDVLEDGSLPFDGWVRVSDGEFVDDLDGTYDGATMAGTYVAGGAGVPVSVAEEVRWDADAGELVVLGRAAEGLCPVPMPVRGLAGTVRVPLDACPDDFLDEVSELVPDPDGGEGERVFDVGHELLVGYRAVALIDLMSCESEGPVLLTFDVPEAEATGGRTEDMRVDMWRVLGRDSEEYVGCLSHDGGEDAYELLDSRGRVVSVAREGRHTRADLYPEMLAEESAEGYEGYRHSPNWWASAFYPAYEDYDSYVPGMENRELAVEPGDYRLEAWVPGGMGLSARLVAVEDGALVLEVGLDGDDESAPWSWQTFANRIRPVTDYRYESFSGAIGGLRKVDAATGKLVTSGHATYRVESVLTGEVTRITTDSDAFVRVPGAASGETFRAVEETAPEGYYVNPVPAGFVDRVASSTKAPRVSNVGVTCDGVSVGKHSADGCDACMWHGFSCECRTFEAVCRCACCGIHSYDYLPCDLVRTTLHKEVPWPSVEVEKVDDAGEPLSGASISVAIEGQGSSGWVSDGGTWTYRFNEEGHVDVAYGSGTRHVVTVREDAPPDATRYLPADSVSLVVGWDSGAQSARLVDDEVCRVDVRKRWSRDGRAIQPPEGARVTLALYADGEATGATVELDGVADASGEVSSWVARFDRLPRRRNGREVTYTVAETSGVDGFTPSGTATAGGSITNERDRGGFELRKVTR